MREGLVTASVGRVTSARAVAEEVVDLACRKLGRALSTPPCRTDSTPLPAPAPPEGDLRASAERAVAEEECRTLRDFLQRRSALSWAPDGGRSAVPAVLETMSALLGWDGDRQAREVKAHVADMALRQAFQVL